ncbi:MAG: class I SAM-dependent methyltransferase [Ilumatobacter sp.]|uniref:class I SAM-dependent methyltransferase n=1 Tax=Ilumatobacter sp. TaxID=1967498 RepID=UPI00260C171A|nr:class I SAM-dependent methyltransferase [Ilumatobacter sp.]MDJ0769345.1 class I SAM-dependent methyltransferase [Ilumatobacter sp.]
MAAPLSGAWRDVAEEWIAWARTPNHDSYWKFHRDRFLALVPPPGALTVDVGCGEGRVGRDLTRHGHRVLGVDASEPAVRAAAAHPEGHPTVAGDAMRLPLRARCADLAVAFMSLQDIDHLDAALAEIARVLIDGGRLHAAIVHPINSAGMFVVTDGDEPPAFTIPASYTESFRYRDDVERDGLTMTFQSWHRPLATYTGALRDAGFVLEVVDEVTEPDDKWARVPLFLHLVARLERRPDA